jgi:hypothetical protein
MKQPNSFSIVDSAYQEGFKSGYLAKNASKRTAQHMLILLIRQRDDSIAFASTAQGQIDKLTAEYSERFGNGGSDVHD